MMRCGDPGGSQGAVGHARAGHTRAWGCRALRRSGWLGCPVSSTWTSWVRAPMPSTLTSDCSEAGERLSAPEDFSAGWCWAFPEHHGNCRLAHRPHGSVETCAYPIGARHCTSCRYCGGCSKQSQHPHHLTEQGLDSFDESSILARCRRWPYGVPSSS